MAFGEPNVSWCKGFTQMSSSSVVSVKNDSELAAALAAATGGETIVLAAGVYNRLKIDSHFASMVTIRAETPGTVSMNGLTMTNSDHVILEGLNFDYAYKSGQTTNTLFSRISGSNDITLRDCIFDGDNYNGTDPNALGYPTGKALAIDNSQHIAVEDSTVRGFWKGIGLDNSNYVTLSGNDIHDMRSDGINLVDSSNLLIEDNYIHDFRANMATGDHPDMIQMWPSGQRGMAHDVTIQGNVLDIGDGAMTQSIFLTLPPQVKTALGAGAVFHDITITDNLIINGHVHGITVSATDGLTISDNTLLVPVNSGLTAPRITLEASSSHVLIDGNDVSRIDGAGTTPDWQVSNNTWVVKVGGVANYGAFFDQAEADAIAALPNFHLQPDGDIVHTVPADPGALQAGLVVADTFTFYDHSYQADFQALAAAGALGGGASPSPDGTGVVLEASEFVDLGRQTDFEACTHLALQIDFSRLAADNSGGRLIWNHTRLGVSVAGDGLIFQVAGSDQKLHKTAVTGLGLNDTEDHRLTLIVDSEHDVLRAVLDGAQILEQTGGVDLDMSGGSFQWGWTLGSPWASAGMAVEVDDFQMVDFASGPAATDIWSL